MSSVQHAQVTCKLRWGVNVVTSQFGWTVPWTSQPCVLVLGLNARRGPPTSENHIKAKLIGLMGNRLFHLHWKNKHELSYTHTHVRGEAVQSEVMQLPDYIPFEGKLGMMKWNFVPLSGKKKKKTRRGTAGLRAWSCHFPSGLISDFMSLSIFLSVVLRIHISLPSVSPFTHFLYLPFSDAALCSQTHNIQTVT